MNAVKRQPLTETAEELHRILRSRLARYRHETPVPLILAQLPFLTKFSDKIRITPQPAPLLHDLSNRELSMIGRWREEGLSATHRYTLCCVVEGDIDFRIGATQRVVRENPALGKKIGRYVLRLPHETFFLMPPGVPFDDGSRPHWIDDQLRAPDSQILWITVLPRGAFLHLCRTRNDVHEMLPSVFVTDGHLISLLGMLTEDLQAARSATGQSYLHLILQRLEHALSNNEYLDAAAGISIPDDKDEIGDLSPDAALAQRACQYIDAHLSRPLTTTHVASQVYVSASHLSHIFQREIGISPMKYLARKRMEVAEKFLEETDMPIRSISRYFSFSHPNVFSRTFVRHSGMTPLDFRKQQRRTTPQKAEQ